MSGRAVLIGIVAAVTFVGSSLAPAAAAETVTIVSPAPGQVSGVVDVDVAVSGTPVLLILRSDGLLQTRLPDPGVPHVLAWDTRGVVNGWHSLTVEVCYSAPVNTCVTSGAVSVQVSNAVPRITSPAPGAKLSGLVRVTLDDTTVAGGALITIDDVGLGRVQAAPYSLMIDVSSFADGPHQLKAYQCPPAGPCGFTGSEPVSVTTMSLHPTVTGQTPGRFSPNGDGASDTTRTSISLPTRESVTWTVVTTDSLEGSVVRGPVAVGVLAAGPHSLVWDGKDNTGAVARDGYYRIVVRTRAGALAGATTSGVRIDTVKPAATGLIGNGATIFPVDDNYKDAYRWAFRIPEDSVVTFRAVSSAGTTVRTKTVTLRRGARGISWDGRRVDGTMVRPGTYGWRLSVTDTAGNRWTSPKYTVRVDDGRLVTTTVSATVAGSRVAEVRSTAACARVGPSPLGSGRMRLVNDCTIGEAGYQTVGAIYRLTLEPFVTYGSLTVKVYGTATSSTESFVWAVPPGPERWPVGPSIWNYVQRRLPASSDTSMSYQLRDYPFLSPKGTVEVGVGVATGLSPTHTLDIKQVQVQLTGQVIR